MPLKANKWTPGFSLGPCRVGPFFRRVDGPARAREGPTGNGDPMHPLVAIATVITSGFVSMRAASERGGPQSKFCNVGRIAVATTYCTAVLAWPLLWSLVFGLGMAAKFPYMGAALVWGAALTIWDLISYASAAPSDWLVPEENRLHGQGTALISTAFASRSRAGEPDKQRGGSGSRSVGPACPRALRRFCHSHRSGTAASPLGVRPPGSA